MHADAADVAGSEGHILGEQGEVLVDLELRVGEPLLVWFELLRELCELGDQGLVDVGLPELRLAHRPLPYLDRTGYLRVLPHLRQGPLYHRLLDHLAAEVQVVSAGLRCELLNQVLGDAPHLERLILQDLR